MTRCSRRYHGAALGSLILLSMLFLPRTALAQLYSWKEAEGNVVIKNAPPPWYKPGERSRGPRVQVLREGKLIDDTAWPMEKRLEGQVQAARREAETLRAGVQGEIPPTLPASELSALLRKSPPGTPPNALPGAVKDAPTIGQPPADPRQ